MSDTKQKTKRKRRWFRYSLRSLLVVVTIFCVVLAYWTHRANRQKAVVKWVEENGGEVYYDFELDEDGFEIEDPKPPGPKWVRVSLGDDYIAAVTYVELQPEYIVKREHSELKDVALLATLGRLKYLHLNNTQVSDLTPLTELTSLKYLYLNNTQVSDLTPLAKLTNLDRLFLNNTEVSDLTPLAGLKSLKFLCLDCTQISDLTPLAGLTSLETLYIGNTQVSDLKPLAGLTSLEWLHVNNTQVSDPTPLAEIKSLVGLHINSVPVSAMMQLKSLPQLYLFNTQVTQEQINVLQTALPNCYIQWSPADKAIEGK